MNENKKVSRMNKLISHAKNTFKNMGKGSKLLIRIAFIVLFVFLVSSVLLIIGEASGKVHFDKQREIIQWLTLYGTRAFAILFCGALILDSLTKGRQKS